MRVRGTVRAAIAEALQRSVRELTADGAASDLELSRAKNPEHGDYASPAGPKLARILRRPPKEIAEQIVSAISVPGGAAEAEAVNGYVNFRLSRRWLQELTHRVAAAGPAYGAIDAGRGERVQVEFLSTNPTGPLHIGHGRGAILGDTLASVLSFAGYRVEREYYVNDFGGQARKFGQSIYARYRGEEPPAGGYFGDYVTELAELARREVPDVASMSPDAAAVRLGMWGCEQMIERFQKTLARLRVRYDSWRYESRLWDEGLAAAARDQLSAAGLLREKDGATWFAPALADESGDEEERVITKSDGTHTYFASDLGYLLDRFGRRGYDRVIEVWGADHYGYIPRIKSGMVALGYDPARLVIVLNQMVSLKEGKMSKRQGRFVTLDELVDRVGVDAVRYFYLLRSPDAMMEFDLELAAAQGNENPVYYAQYAHARLANVERFASERRLPPEADVSLLVEPWELDLARQIAFWPEVVEEAARLYEPHRLAFYVHDLADQVHGFYQAGNRDWRHRVVVDDPALTRARLELCRAARNTLKSALDLMGVSAPDQM